MPALLFLDLPETGEASTDIPPAPPQLQRDQLVGYEGGTYFIRGFDPLSVVAPRVYLEDTETHLPRTADLEHLIENRSLAVVQ
jgi:hypothetical protein